MGGRKSARALAWVAIAGQVAFVASWIVAGALEPHYTHVLQGVSELAARDAAHPWIVMTGIAVLGASLVVLAAALARTLPRRRALPVALFALAGVGAIAVGLIQLDCGTSVDRHCSALWHAGQLSWRQDAHVWIDFASQLLVVLTPFALARALWPGTVAAAALFLGAVGIVIGVLTWVGYSVPGSAGGLVQRDNLASLHLWVLIVAIGILYATRGAPRFGELIPMRPRDFFARSWRGDGELVLRPFFVGRLFAQRARAFRDCAWVSDRVWLMEDRCEFAGGYVERRRMFCELVGDDRVRLTANDLLDDVRVVLEPGGFRMPEWRMTWPVGPLPVVIRCVDRSYVEPDGTYVNVVDALVPGLRIPLARMTFHVRPVTGEAPASEHEPALELT